MKEFVEKLIERLEEETYVWNDGYRNGIKSAITIVKQLAEEYVPDTNVGSNLSGNLTGWIPCSERLPEDGSKVIITTRSGNVTAGIYTKNYKQRIGFGSKEGFTCDICFIYLESVTAWLPLPKPYKPKEIPADHYIERFNKVN